MQSWIVIPLSKNFHYTDKSWHKGLYLLQCRSWVFPKQQTVDFSSSSNEYGIPAVDTFWCCYYLCGLCLHTFTITYPFLLCFTYCHLTQFANMELPRRDRTNRFFYSNVTDMHFTDPPKYPMNSPERTPIIVFPSVN